MNNFIKLPLFLGATCLIASGLLAVTVGCTDPIIEQHKLDRLAKAYENMYSGEAVEVLDSFELTDEFMEANKIYGLTRVKHGEATSAVYQVQSESSYEIMQFYVGISFEDSSVDGYYLLESNKASLGQGHFKNKDEVMGVLNDYNGGATQNPIISGVTFTSKAVKAAVDSALNDFKTRNWEEK